MQSEYKYNSGKTPANEMRRKRLENPRESGNDQIVRDADSGCARAQISQKHRDMIGEHECMKIGRMCE